VMANESTKFNKTTTSTLYVDLSTMRICIDIHWTANITPNKLIKQLYSNREVVIICLSFMSRKSLGCVSLLVAASGLA
jgi:hypothetical protein